MRRVFFQILLSVICAWAWPAALAQDSPFVRPAALEPAVNFWKRVYTEATTNGGFVHDDTRLDVVYSVMEFSPSLNGVSRNKRIDDEKRFVAATLRKLAAGMDDLSKDERRVRAAWPDDTSRLEFSNAIDRVRFQLGQADRFKEGLIRSGAWREEIKRVFKRHGLPEELAALPHVESSFNTYAYSKVGAAGMWQFMRSTGKRYLRIDNIVDERLDPYKASIAAANFMQQNYAVVGSWPLAVTAYNHGAGGMLRAKQQLGTDDIGVIVQQYDGKTFGFASRNFYACFLAALDIDSDPEKYFPGIELNAPDNSKVMPIKNFTAMPSLAKSLQVDSAVLKQLNPALMAAIWTGRKRIPSGFELRVPGSADQAAALRNLPSAAQASAQIVEQRHRVRKGESLAAIARKYGLSLTELARLNGLRKPYRVAVGKTLQLPSVAAPASAAATASMTPEDLVNGSNAEVRYTVSAGDTLDKIAKRYALSASELLALNKLDDANQVRVGQRLLIHSAGELPSEPDASAVETEESDITPAAEARAEKAEPKTEGEAEALGPTLLPGVQAAASADPVDYSVVKGKIHVEAAETLGHYADWLETTPSKLRALNKLPVSLSMQVGQTIKLDLSQVSAEQFAARRRSYHQQLQEAFFAQYRIVGSDLHVMKKGESIWVLSQKTYNVPVWLLRQYNPALNLEEVRPGAKLVIPRIALAKAESEG